MKKGFDIGPDYNPKEWPYCASLKVWRNGQRIYQAAYDNAIMGDFPFIINLGLGIQLDIFDNDLNNYYESARQKGIADAIAEVSASLQ